MKKIIISDALRIVSI